MAHNWVESRKPMTEACSVCGLERSPSGGLQVGYYYTTAKGQDLRTPEGRIRWEEGEPPCEGTSKNDWILSWKLQSYSVTEWRAFATEGEALDEKFRMEKQDLALNRKVFRIDVETRAAFLQRTEQDRKKP